MTIRLANNTFFVFDLDDTLYQEIDFLRSAYRAISRRLAEQLRIDIYDEMWQGYVAGKNVFASIIDKYGDKLPTTTLQGLVQEYREHIPEITLAIEVKLFLETLEEKNIGMGLITDGRSITQRNKLNALGIGQLFSDIIISEEFGSEKPSANNYLHFQNKYPDKNFFFIGDNTIKDFIVPLQLGWKTICIKNNGENIHPQNFDCEAQPNYVISSFEEIELM